MLYHTQAPFWDKEAKDLYAVGDHPLDFDNLYAVRNYEHHAELRTPPGNRGYRPGGFGGMGEKYGRHAGPGKIHLVHEKEGAKRVLENALVA